MPPRPPTLALKSLIREAKRNYMESSKKRVIVRSLGHPPGVPQPMGVNPPIGWGLVKIKTCRPLDSVVLPKGLLEMIVADARNFISSEDWYVRAGIPYRRGYLFYGAPGTGKTSTIYALAGALGLEIYSLSLAADKLTDTTLKSVVSRIPKRGILLIEDIDCAFTSREDEEEEASNVSSALIKHIQPSPMIGVRPPLKPQPTNVTMSGLLNVLDGVESDEGKIFMATTNYVDRLDPALIRPGRLDLKVKYELADRHQITSLFNRFFSPPDEDEPEESAEKFRNDQSITYVAKASQHPLAEEFGDLIPEGEFSIAELQGFLLSCRHDPQVAVDKAIVWVETERTERADRELKESERKQKLDEKRQARDLLVVQAVANANSVILPKPVVPSTTGSSSSSSSSDSKYVFFKYSAHSYGGWVRGYCVRSAEILSGSSYGGSEMLPSRDAILPIHNPIVQNGGLIQSLLSALVRFLGLGSVIGSVLPGLAGGRSTFSDIDQFEAVSDWDHGGVGETLLVVELSITARFSEGDPIHEWIVLYLTDKKVWHRSRDYFAASDKSKPAEETIEYLPSFDTPQLFRWNGYWIEVMKDTKSSASAPNVMYMSSRGSSTSTLCLNLYTLNHDALNSLIEEAKAHYIDTSKQRVISKTYRPLESIILPEGVLSSIVADARDFIASENWYARAGIPYRRGYLFYGPPGTGKSSTVYALAGELGLEIYTLSLSSDAINDTTLRAFVEKIPKRGILLIEDIDCAFPSREDEEDQAFINNGLMRGNTKRSAVTMSGLLNVLDGVDSEEGKIFMATTNYVDKLDPALMRPGRIDMKIQYKLASSDQATALFNRFFAEHDTSSEAAAAGLPYGSFGHHPLANDFAAAIPEDEFTIAELQGLLLSCKTRPEAAVSSAPAWVNNERQERISRQERERERKDKLIAANTRRKAMVGNYTVGGGLFGVDGYGSHEMAGFRGNMPAPMARPPPPPVRVIEPAEKPPSKSTEEKATKKAPNGITSKEMASPPSGDLSQEDS
ncbi:hypothetical protein ONZ45_g1923 [Pleurotus djamor]|nr:hypothetical protein ONZ45_g1923 [Pleurotus djamor]